MMRRSHALVLGMLLFSLLGARALAQSLPPPAAGSNAALSVPETIKRSPTLSPAELQTLRKFVTDAVAQLRGADPAAQTAARTALMREVELSAVSRATPAYEAEYARLLNEALLPLVNQNDLRLKLNAAIVADRVASRSESNLLLPLTLQLLGDSNAAIAMWGVKAADGVMLGVIRNPLQRQNNPLIAALVDSVRRHSGSGMLIGDAYQALTLRHLDVPSASPPVPVDQLAVVVPAMQDLLELRIGKYVQGTVVNPTGEVLAASFLANPAVLRATQPEQKARTVQLLVDLLSVSAQRAMEASPAERGLLMDVVMRSLSSVQAAVGNPEVTQLISNARGNLGPLVAPARIAQLIDPIYNAVKQLPEYAGLRQPPKVKPPGAVTDDPAGAAPPATTPTANPTATPATVGG